MPRMNKHLRLLILRMLALLRAGTGRLDGFVLNQDHVSGCVGELVAVSSRPGGVGRWVDGSLEFS